MSVAIEQGCRPVDQVAVVDETYAQWFERTFPRLAMAIVVMHEAGISREEIERTITRHCRRRDIHHMAVIGCRAYMSRRLAPIVIPWTRLN